MSLIAWYPLNNNNTQDYSGYNRHGEIVGTLNLDGGKIGSAYVFTNSSNGINIPNNNFTDLTDFTITAWINPAGNHQNYDGTIISSGNWNSSHWSFGIGQNNSGFSCRNPYVFAGNASYNFTLNQWHFVAYRRKGSELSLYANDTLVYKGTVSSNIPLSSDANNTMIGRETYAGGYFSFNGKIQDVRIYDHALSDKEIKEIAKAKILHYTFDDFQEPTENLLFNYIIQTTHTKADINGWEIVGVSNDNPRKIIAQNIPVLPLTTYTFSAIYWSSDGILDDVYLQFNDSGWTEGNIYHQPFIGQGGKSSVKIEQLPNELKRYSATFTTNADTNTIVNVFFDSDVAGRICFLGNVQLEAKDHATPFTPSTRTGIVSDISGYKNDAALDLATTPQWTNNSKIGSGAYRFATYQNFSSPIKMTSPVFSRNDSQFTIAAWVKLLDNPANDATLIGGAYYSGFAIAINSAGQIRGYFRNSTGQYGTSSFSLIKNQWHHITVVLDSLNSLLKLYIDGVLYSQSSISIGNFNYETMYFRINAYQQTGGNYFSTCNCELDDVRLYATALANNDILEIYNTRSQMHNTGNTQIVELKEYNNWDISINNSNLIYNGDGSLGNNTNFPNLVYNNEEQCFTITSGTSEFRTTDFIKINGNGLDRFDQYILDGYFKQPSGQMSRYYYMLICYDKDKNFIDHDRVAFYTNTATTLSQPLNNGDIYVYLTTVQNWTDDGLDQYNHTKTFACWPIGVAEYPNYTYSRHVANVTFVDKVNNRLKLQSPWNQGFVPAGSAAINSYSGGTYSYIAAANALMTTDWVYRSGISSATANIGSMRYGTEYVKIGALINWEVTGQVTSYIKNMRFYNITNKGQSTTFTGQNFNINQNGLLINNYFSEVGPIEGLVAYYSLDNHTKDYSGYQNHGTLIGGSFIHGVQKQGAAFLEANHRMNINNITGKALTLSCWHKWDYGSSNWRTLFGNNSNIHHVIFSADRVLSLWDGSQKTYGYTLLDNEWHHYTIVIVSASYALLYVDGTYIGRTNTTLDLNTYPVQVIGNWGGNSYPAGYMDEIRIYDKILTPQEIQILYNMTKPQKNQIIIANNIIYSQNQFLEVI